MSAEVLSDAPDLALNMIARIGGAELGVLPSRIIGGGSGGHQIIQAGAGSRAAQAVVDKIPIKRLKQVLTEAFLNDDLMVDLLARPQTSQQAVKLSQHMYASLYDSGLLFSDGFGLAGEGRPPTTATAVPALPTAGPVPQAALPAPPPPASQLRPGIQEVSTP